MSLMSEIAESLEVMTESQVKAVATLNVKALGKRVFTPNSGPQTDAYLSDADDLFYGGEAGGGKTHLIIGCALEEHENSLVLRRTNKESAKFINVIEDMTGTRDGWNGQTGTYSYNGKSVETGGVQLEDDKQKYKGDPKDLIAFDEITDFTESQFRFIKIWNRSTKPGQRVRMIATGNPPTNVVGLWVVKYWAPWLDKSHPNPAKDGELRWFVTPADKDVEVDGPDPVEINGEILTPRSRTFIRARLSDNPDLMETGYAEVLGALPAELRRAYRDGNFSQSVRDQEMQLIPRDWVRMAMDRWTETPPDLMPMTSLALDVALGGGTSSDWNQISRRHGPWFDQLVGLQEFKTDNPTLEIAMLLLGLRRNNAIMSIDMGGGYGSGVHSHLSLMLGQAGQDCIAPFVPSGATNYRDRSRKFEFKSVRCASHWALREALEPNLGADIALPPDTELEEDLISATYSQMNGYIYVEKKEKIKAKIGRSPDKGDAVIMSHWTGERPVTTVVKSNILRNSIITGRAKVNTGRSMRWSKNRNKR